MCGTGVLQALGPAGAQTLLLRMFTFCLLYCWQVVAAIDDRRPDMPLALVHGRLLLLAAPLLLFSTWRFGQAMGARAIPGAGELLRRAVCPGGIHGRQSDDRCALRPDLGRDVFWRRAAGDALGVVSMAPARTCRAAGRRAGRRCHPALDRGRGHGDQGPRRAPIFWRCSPIPAPGAFFCGQHGGAGFALFGLLAFTAAEGAAGFYFSRDRPAIPTGGRPGLGAGGAGRPTRFGWPRCCS